MTEQEIINLIAREILGWRLTNPLNKEEKFWDWNPLSELGQSFYVLKKAFKYPEYEWAIINTSEGYCVRISHIHDQYVDESDYRSESLCEAICYCCLSAKGIEIP